MGQRRTQRMVLALLLGGGVFSQADNTVAQAAPSNSVEGFRIEQTVVSDPAFDRFASMALIAEAFSSRDASLLADVALQMQQGERVLMREHLSGVTSRVLLQKAVEIAGMTGDSVTLDRVNRTALMTGDEKLSQQVMAARKLGTSSRDASLNFPVDIRDVDMDTYKLLSELMNSARAAELAADKDQIRMLQAKVSAAAIPAPYAERFQDWSEKMLITAPEATPESTALGQLVASSRSHWITRPEDWLSKGPKIFKSGNDGGGTSGWDTEISRPQQNNQIQVDDQVKKRFTFTLWNSCKEMSVHVRTPTGRVDSIAPGHKRTYRFTGNAEDAVMHIVEAKRTYHMRAGDHKLSPTSDGRVKLIFNY